MSILSMTAVELAAAIKKREVTVKEAVEAVLDNIEGRSFKAGRGDPEKD